MTALWSVLQQHLDHPALDQYKTLFVGDDRSWMELPEDKLISTLSEIVQALLVNNQGGAPAAPPPGPSRRRSGDNPVAGRLARFGEVDPNCLSLLFAPATAQALRQNQLTGLPELAPRWLEFPTISCKREVLYSEASRQSTRSQGPVGEKFTLSFFNTQ